jgi:hypothetical protein
VSYINYQNLLWCARERNVWSHLWNVCPELLKIMFQEYFFAKKEYHKQRRPSRIHLSSFPTTYIYGPTGPRIVVTLWYFILCSWRIIYIGTEMLWFHLSSITTKCSNVAVFIIAELHTIFYTWYVAILIVYTKFHCRTSSYWSVTSIKPKAEISFLSRL